LPIMLVTGLHERRRAVARTTGLTVPAGGVGRWLTWRRALVGGGIAFGGLAAVAIGYTAMRLLGIGPVGTLVASGVLKDREPLVLADFENRSADSTLGPSLTEAFRVDLSQSPTMRVLDAAGVADALRRMERTGGGPLPIAQARELAVRQGIKAVVGGQIDPVGKGYVISASLVTAADGHVLTAVRETAAGEDQLLGAIDQLSKKLRERVGESLVSIRSNPPLEQVTTSSLPALRKYSEALRLEEQDRMEAAIPLLREAVALDSGFAMAHRKLAVLLGNLGGHDAEQVAAATRAFAHRDRLPELEGDLAAGYYHQWVDYDADAVVASYRAALDVEPDNLPALNNLAVELGRRRQWVEAESLTVRAARLGRGAPFMINAVVAQVAQGHFDAASGTLARYAAQSPGSPSLLDMRAGVAIAQGDYAAGSRLLQELLAAQRPSQDWQARTATRLGQLNRLTGRLDDAERFFRLAMAANEARGSAGDYLAGAAELARVEAELRLRPDSAIRTLTDALARHPLAGIPALERPYSVLVLAYLRAGQPETARRLWREYDAAVPVAPRRGDLVRRLAEGAMAELDRRPDSAAVAYRAWYDETGQCGACGLFDLARLADQAGRTDSALALYQRGFAIPSVGRYALDASQLAPALKRAGELYEAKGDRAGATKVYQRFADLWKDADPALQPGVREIRARIARLATEASS
jgi:tetratricopeptide (TPR) repeat protein